MPRKYKRRYKSKEQKALDRAHWLSEDLILEAGWVANAAEELLEVLYEHSKPVRRQVAKHLPQMELLILNLLKANQDRDGLMIVPFRPAAYGDTLTFRVTKQHHIDTLIGMGWLDLKKGYQSAEGSRRSRVKILRPLRDWLRRYDSYATQIDRKAPKKAVFVKDDNKDPIVPPALMGNQIAIYEQELRPINQLLERTSIDLFINDHEVEELNDRMSDKAEVDPFQQFKFDPTQRYLKRVFNNSSLAQGGRFYGAWWQSIPSEYRPLISLNGDYVVELDYSTIHMHLLYALSKATYPLEDHYVFGRLTKDFRSQTKKMMNILINAKSQDSAIKAAKDQELFKAGLPEGIDAIEAYVEEIYSYHDAIQKYFGTGYGVHLQFLDSQIALRVMQRMYPEPCLPVHDSFVVRSRQEKKLNKVMNEEFTAVTGVKAGIKSESLEVTTDRKIIIDEMIDDELSDYSLRLYNWRKKYNWKYFVDGGDGSDKPFKD